MKKIAVCFLTMLFMLLSFQSFASKKGVKKDIDLFACPLKEIIFDDGDTITCNGENIRMAGIDTPEIKHPKHGISKDQPYGKKAAALTKKLIKKAGGVTIIRAGKDKYGRTLGFVFVNGELLGVELINAGLAYETVSFYGDNGFPEYALQIKNAWNNLPEKPNFENPHDWRKKNQKK